jgi:aspartate ammonia-lyase
MATRQEKDSLGLVDVPADALYGAQTARAVENFPISGLRASTFLIRAAAAIKLAAARANGDLGLITADQAKAIQTAAQEVLDGQHHEHFVVDVFQAGAGVSFHMNTNEVLANRAEQLLGGALGEYSRVHPNDHVNYGQSTNDVFPTAMRVSALMALRPLDEVLISLAEGLRVKATEFDGILKSGRTHMQDAVPIRLGQEFAAYAVAIDRAQTSITQNAESLRELGLGGSAVGTGINTDPHYRELAINFQVIGNDAAVAMAVQAGQLELNVMMPTMAHNVLQSITILTNTLRELDHRCIRGITANEARCAFYAQSTVSLATALNPYIGYARAAQVVKQSVATGKSIIDIVREEKLLTEAQIATILDARAMTEPRSKT